MKKLSAILLVVLTSSTVFAIMPKGRMTTMQAKLKLVEKIASEQIGKNATDFRVGKATVSRDGACGGEGPTILVDIEMRKVVRALDENENVVLKDEWQVIKSYGVTAAELNGPITVGLQDLEGCTE